MLKQYFIAPIIALSMIACTNKGTTNTTENKALTEADSIKLAMESISDDTSMYLLVGTYTSGESDGIYVYQFDTISGYSKYVSMAKVDNPSYLAISKDEKFVYAVTENDDNTSAANALSFDKKDGKLKLLNTQLTGGGAPCYITVDRAGKHVVTANYLGASITLFNTNEDGTLAPASSVISFMGKGVDERQSQPHLHCVVFSPDEKYLFASDLGTDKIHKFEVNDNSTEDFLKISTPPAFKIKDGSGPRHLEFHPNGKYAYLITELSGSVIAFEYNNGDLKEFQSIQADTLNAKGSGDIHISPDGRFLYASNRLKGDGLAIYSINQTDGKLTKVGYQDTGIHPRNFAITPNGKYLLVASRDNDIIQIFEIDKKTGLLENVYKDIKLDMPVCLKFASFK
ncbi:MULTISPECIES: lactonase family protein [unclassified Dysgonomonas]|uniref:lactonase family protein n=1 Tax=unclassified Dysgonomonas TaxID=2630389 RepID=UPI0013EDABA4|nr:MULTISPECIES: lactonase family protein [unclassified Dysgonomonas]